MPKPKLSTVYNLITLESCESTNEEARIKAQEGKVSAPDGTLIWAKKQTAGRGRRGRTWNSNDGNLHISLILRPNVPLRKAAQLGFVTALAVFDALGNISESWNQIHLKWPNDVLLHEKKVAGILLEAETGGKEIPNWIIVGLGLNVTYFPNETTYPATSLAAESWSASVEVVLEAFARSFQIWVNNWVDSGFEPIRRTWLERAIGLGKGIEVRLEDQTIAGIFRNIDQEGRLIIDQKGTERHIAAGDVYFLNN